jgi:isoquinoline 1-oxidoreductase beta subunit
MRRRTFLLGSAAATGGLIIGYHAWSASFERAAAGHVGSGDGSLIAGWVKIAPDDTVTVYVPHIDMGQGTHTALAMMLAEELDADWSKVRTERAPGEKSFANKFLARGWVMQNLTYPRVFSGAVDRFFAEAARFIDLQVTGGSTAVRFTGRIGMRTVGAAARAMLIEAAARKWDVPARRLTARDSMVTDPQSGQVAAYGELAEAASRLSVPTSPPLKRPSEWRLVGTSPLRLDIPAKVDGSFAYGIDFTLPDMLHAALRAAPVHGGRLVDVDTSEADAAPAVEHVLRLEHAVAVVARSWWCANQALAKLEPRFSDQENGGLSTAGFETEQDRLLKTEAGTGVVSDGSVEDALAGAGEDRVLAAEYRVPYLHHAAIEPISLTAQFAEGRLTVWGGEQDALGTKARLMKLSGLGADAVLFHGLPAGGSFGRRIPPSADYLDHLVPIALAMAPRPVKLILSREEEFTHGAYRPALATRMRAALGQDGRPIAWEQAFLSGPTRNEGFAVPYAIPNQSIRSIDFATHIRTGTWRSVAHSQHAFWTESFIDELAHAAGQDPYDYRRSLLPEGSRERLVLETAALRADWNKPLAPGTGRGIAIAESFGTIVAEVVEASLAGDGMPRVHRVVAAVDCGGVVHPDTARQQVEGAIVMALSAALYEEITVENGSVVQANFSDYRIMKLDEAPEIEVHFVDSPAPWGGLGEPGVPPAAPALCNALFAATGRRIRRLPVVRSA